MQALMGMDYLAAIINLVVIGGAFLFFKGGTNATR